MEIASKVQLVDRNIATKHFSHHFPLPSLWYNPRRCRRFPHFSEFQKFFTFLYVLLLLNFAADKWNVDIPTIVWVRIRAMMTLFEIVNKRISVVNYWGKLKRRKIIHKCQSSSNFVPSKLINRESAACHDSPSTSECLTELTRKKRKKTSTRSDSKIAGRHWTKAS